jgi:hypothetical protein
LKNYAEQLNRFENVENLGGKAWEHAVICDLLGEHGRIIKDCTPHCTNYQQLLEMLLKHALESRSKYNAYSRTHNLNNLLQALVETSDFKTDLDKYSMALNTVTMCAQEYRYDFQLQCHAYWMAVAITDNLLVELLEFLFT